MTTVRRLRPSPSRLTWPQWVILDAPPAVLGGYLHRHRTMPYWGVSWRRRGGRLTLAPDRVTTEFPHHEPLRVLVSAPADCEEVWASLILSGSPVRQACRVSPVTIVAEDRHDPAAGLYYPPAFPYVLLGV